MAKYEGATAEKFAEYHDERGREIPSTADDAAIDAALLVASEWIDNTYGKLFIGEKASGFLQERQWPRINARVGDYTFPKADIPKQIISAVYEAALRQLLNPGSLLVDYTPGKYKSVSIQGAVSVEFAGFTMASEAQSTFPIIDQLLEPLISETGSFASFSGSLSRV